VADMSEPFCSSLGLSLSASPAVGAAAADEEGEAEDEVARAGAVREAPRGA
jgi:hypothetical protein